MKKALRIVFLASISLIVCACHKFSIGESKSDFVQLQRPFQVVEFRDNVNVTLLHCDEDHPAGYIWITAPENLWDNIIPVIDSTKETNGDTIHPVPFTKLTIRNDNSLNYLHSYDYTIKATVYYDSLYHLIFHSNGEIHTDTLRGFNCMTQFSNSDSTWTELASNLLMEVEGGSGNFNVLTNCYWTRTKFIHGTSDITVKGFADMSSIYADYDCHGVIDESELVANFHFITSYGTNTVSAKAFHTFNAKNFNTGRVYYVEYDQPGTVTHWAHQDSTGHWVPSQVVDTLYHCPLHLVRGGSNRDNIMPMP